MKTEDFFHMLKEYMASYAPNFGDVESVLTILYESYNENNRYDNEQIRENFLRIISTDEWYITPGDG